MRKLFKHLKPYAATIAAIVVILIVQAYCDLSLPSYTSDIVNVGIQQGGIDEKIPDAIAEEEMNKLLLFVAEEDQQTVLDAYEKKESDSDYKYDGAIYVLKDSVKKDEEKSGKVFDILGKPMLLTYGFESGSDTTKKMEESMKENMISSIKEQAEKQAESMQSQMTDEQKAALAANPELAKKQQDEMQKKQDQHKGDEEQYGRIRQVTAQLTDQRTADLTEVVCHLDGLRQRAKAAEKAQILIEHPLLRQDVQQLSAILQMREQRLRRRKRDRDGILQRNAFVHQHRQRPPVFTVRSLLPKRRKRCVLFPRRF